ncbi:S8 family serine peptidase [Baekduia soli]|uniref:S8 family serine peptidase n=1 Tax=Baekduia soli TaxID=496014 RepID=A0A5B8U2U5_9ACTN|nr:S8 family serine peptidase [Baekduia soli]QEC47334.1 S8 family serine peptidase [Baekduia soli]
MPSLPRLPALGALLLALLAVPSAAHAAPAARAGEVVVAYRDPPGAHAARMAQPRAPHVLHVRDVAATIRRLRARPDVRYAVPNVVAHAAEAFVPNDPGRTPDPAGWQQTQWNFTGPASVDAPDAWGNLIAAGRPGGKGVVVAVLDTGVAYRRFGRTPADPDLAATKFVAGYDFVGRDPYANDHNGHGTHVASTIAESTNNAIGLTGLAYGASIMPVKVLDDLGSGDAAEIARGVRFAARKGAKVINLSLEFSSDVTSSEIPQLLDAIAYAHRRGAMVVAASGNEAVTKVAYPARATYVVSVGSTTEHGCLSDFSNQGSGLDLVAPGGGPDAYLTDPGCVPDGTPGRNIAQMTLIGLHRDTFGIPGGYEGTSMAVPHVSAAAALVIASGVLGPDPTPDAVQRRLEVTARDLGAPGYDTRYGYGLINAGTATDPAVPVG